METLIVLIVIFLGGQVPDVKIVQVYGNGDTCIQDAEEFQRKAGPDYRFKCEPIHFTRA